MIHIKQNLLGDTLCELDNGQTSDVVTLENLHFYSDNELCPECLFRLNMMRGKRKSVKDDSSFDTPLALLVKRKVRDGEIPYRDIRKEFPQFKVADVNRFIKTVCGWD